MLKSRILFSLNLNEILYQRTFRNSKWLGDNNVIFIREKIKCKLDKIKTSGFIKFINTKQVDNNSIISFIWNFGKFIDLKVLNKMTILSEVKVFSISTCNFRLLLFFFFFNLSYFKIKFLALQIPKSWQLNIELTYFRNCSNKVIIWNKSFSDFNHFRLLILFYNVFLVIKFLLDLRYSFKIADTTKCL